MTPSMTRVQAQAARRDELQDAMTAAGCRSGFHPDHWFREDGEDYMTWQARRAELKDYCRTTCPVMEACLELALRDRDGDERVDMHVRGGLSSLELTALGREEKQRLAEAAVADEAAELERRCINAAARELQRQVGITPGPRYVAAHNARVRELAGELQQLQRARRARTGWWRAA